MLEEQVKCCCFPSKRHINRIGFAFRDYSSGSRLITLIVPRERTCLVKCIRVIKGGSMALTSAFPPHDHQSEVKLYMMSINANQEFESELFAR